MKNPIQSLNDQDRVEVKNLYDDLDAKFAALYDEDNEYTMSVEEYINLSRLGESCEVLVGR